jgi:hypothetical protein
MKISASGKEFKLIPEASGLQTKILFDPPPSFS